VAIVTTPLGFKKPDGNELFRNGDNVIADNAQTAQDILAAHAAAAAALAARVGQVEADVDAGSGTGLGLAADPDSPGLYFFSDGSPIEADPDNPGLYTF